MLKPKEKLELTKQKLITATNEILAEHGNDYKSLTSREIAKRAGVPLGMINYCFESKDNLVLKVFLDTYTRKWDETKVNIFKLDGEGMDARDQLKYFAFKIMKIFLAHYECIKDILKYIMTSYDITSAIQSHELISECVGGKRTEEQCKLMSFELGSILQIAVLRHKELKENFGIDLYDDEQLKAFIGEQVDKIVC